LALSLCAATELVSAEPATETTKPANSAKAQSAQAAAQPTNSTRATSDSTTGIRGRADAKHCRSTDASRQRLGEVVWKDASTADSQTTKLARNGSATRSTLNSTETSLLTKALLAKPLLAEALLAEALLAEALLTEALLSKAALAEARLSKAGVSETCAAESRSAAESRTTAELRVRRLVNYGTERECRR
jgi:uncharacterized protein YjbI with pentapeptide repeats